MKNLVFKLTAKSLRYAPALTSIDMSICNQVAAITALAILSYEVVHIEVKYIACLHLLDVKVLDGKTDLFMGSTYKFGCAVYLDSPSALEQLKVLEDKLIDAVVDAKEHGC